MPAAMESATTRTDAAPGPRAVVWTVPGGEPPPELLAALSRGNLGVERVSSPYLALAHLCRLQRTAGSDPRTASGALVLVSPERLACPGHVCDAAARFAPRTRLWMYEPGSNRGLRAIVQEDVDSWLKTPASIEAKPVVVMKAAPNQGGPAPRALPLRSPDSRTKAESGPKLRLAGESLVQEVAQSADEVDKGDRRPREVLTSEELEMLLDDGEPRKDE